MTQEEIFIAGDWREARAPETFRATNPATKEPTDALYPVSSWADCDAALEASQKAYQVMRTLKGGEIASFLETYADKIEESSDELVETAHTETALPKSPRLGDVELPRTTSQLRQAAAAAREGSWRNPVIDTENDIRSCYAALGPVAVFGPNNFPFAFGSLSGGDFAAAIAAGNPVIGKANTSHPGTTRIFAELAQKAAKETGMPDGIVQLLYRTSHEDGNRLVSDSRIGATGYTGSRGAGLSLKASADAAGKPIYLELSSVNPVVILPGAIEETGVEALASEFAGSCLMGTGQFCTNPGLVVLLADEKSEALIGAISRQFQDMPEGILLSQSVESSLVESQRILQEAGATAVCGTGRGRLDGFSCANTLLRVSGADFCQSAETLQTEAFGNCSLLVVAGNCDEARDVLEALEGNLTGCVYSATDGSDETVYQALEPVLRQKAGRLLNDKMPTGVAVSPAMNHGGPYPATGHPGFTAVGIPAAITRFAALHCYDQVRESRLPEILRDDYAGPTQRFVDGSWT